MSSNSAIGASGSGASSIYQGAKAGHQYGQEALAVIRWIANMLKVITTLVAYPWEIILRYEFGERYLNGWMVFFSSMVISFIATLFDSLFGQIIANALVGYWVLHKLRIRKRNKQGTRWHSLCNGLSRVQQLFPSIPSSRVDLVIEPLILALVGLVLIILTYDNEAYETIWGSGVRSTYDGFGLFMIFSGFCLHLHQSANYKRHRNLLLDQIDSQIVSEHFADALKGEANAQQTDGFVVQGADSWTAQERQIITAAVSGQGAYAA